MYVRGAGSTSNTVCLVPSGSLDYSPPVPLFMGFSRQEYWNVLTFPSPGDPTDLWIELRTPASPALAGRFFTR